ncbi:Uncharacterized protein GBIM_07644 [Gryllus bimaculatus]|nr:Uncharacterized protein GBIM_07644 [Gryllus bimaculatus]
MEKLHLVHWNSTKYSSFGEAASQPDGLAVLGILLQSGEANEELEKIVKRLSEVQHRGEKIKISDPINPVKFLPEETAYWTYLGSLTTPPCNESVIWILFKQAIEVSDEQLAAFRQLRCYAAGEECPCDELRGFVSLNYRPPLPLGERQLRESRVA